MPAPDSIPVTIVQLDLLANCKRLPQFSYSSQQFKVPTEYGTAKVMSESS